MNNAVTTVWSCTKWIYRIEQSLRRRVQTSRVSYAIEFGLERVGTGLRAQNEQKICCHRSANANISFQQLVFNSWNSWWAPSHDRSAGLRKALNVESYLRRKTCLRLKSFLSSFGNLTGLFKPVNPAWIRACYQCFLGSKPNVSNFRVFGCKAYMHIPKEKRRK